MKNYIIYFNIILCSTMLSQDCPEGEISLWPGYAWDCFAVTDTMIDFSNVYAPINAPIPPEIEQLVNLKILDLSNGQLNISGEIPAEIGNLANLKYLDLSNQQLTGSIPPEIGQLSNLEELYITAPWNSSGLTGSIPSEIGDLDNLTWLDLSDNNLSGSIPPEIGDMSSLKWLELMNNNFSGTIPSEVGDMNTLLWMYLDGNELISPIPSEIGDMSSLKRLSLSDNQFTGSIPIALGNINTLEQLYLYSNQFNGEIPSELGQLSSLVILSLGSNQLTGNIPNDIIQLINYDDLYNGNGALGSLDLNNNQLSGEIPNELSGLVSLNLSNNNFSGPLPEDIFWVNELYLSYNQFSGELTESMFDHLSCVESGEYCVFCSFPDYVYINDNQLSGELPDNICNLSCSWIGLENNQFCGPYPDCEDLSYANEITNENFQDTSGCTTCGNDYTEIDGECYNNNDLNFLQSLIDNSQNTSSDNISNENPPDSNMSPLNLGHQVWQDLEDDIWSRKRLIEFCSTNNTSNENCFSDYILSGQVPSLESLDGLLYLDLRDNQIIGLADGEWESNLEYLYLSNNNIDSFPMSIYNMGNLKELYISNNYMNSIIEIDETCDFFGGLINYSLNGNYICDSPSCIDISAQNTFNCCDTSLDDDYINYLGNCYFEPDLNIINNITENMISVNTIWNNSRVVELNLNNNQLDQVPEEIFQLNQLQALYLSNNTLVTFPFASLSSLTNLITLDLSLNEIADLDENYCSLYNSLNFNLTSNPICGSPFLLSCLENDVCVVLGCSDSEACNYNEYTTDDDGSCEYPEENYDCNDECIVNIDCFGICGGSAIVDECGVCDGSGVAEGYDCEGNFLNVDDQIPGKFEILDIYPNPFNPTTTITLAVDLYRPVTIDILNLNGTLIENIVNTNLHPGVYNFEWKPRNISNGLYFIVINNGVENIIQKVTFIK